MLQGNHRGLPLHAILLDIVLTGYERSYILNTQDCSGLTKYPTSGCWRGLAEHSIPPQVSNTNWRPCGHPPCSVRRPARSGKQIIDCSGLTKYPTSGCWRGLAEHSIPPQVSNTNWRPCGHPPCSVRRPARSGKQIIDCAGLTKYPASGCWQGLPEHSIPPQASNTNRRPCGHPPCAVGRPARSGKQIIDCAGLTKYPASGCWRGLPEHSIPLQASNTNWRPCGHLTCAVGIKSVLVD